MRSIRKKCKLILKQFDGLILGNTVLEKGMIIAPIVVAAYSLMNAVVLGITFAVITFFGVLASSYIPRKIPYAIRVILNTIIAALLYIPVHHLLNLAYPETVYGVGVFLPLLVTNSMIVYKSEAEFHMMKRSKMIFKLLNHIGGFLIVLFMVGGLREFFGNATLWGKPVQWDIPISGLLFPFGGFILIGFLAALFNKFSLYLDARKPHRKIKRKVVIKDELLE